LDTFERTVEFALESRLFLVNFSPLTPTPGTRLYERMRAAGRLVYESWWLDPRYRYGQATFHPHQMSADELTEGCIGARRAFYRYSSILRRAFSPRTNARSLHHLAIYVGANLISRRELDQKLGHRLGADAPLQPLLEAI
jgi:radical SAM superfamily enzyme YgiQ (UPF0313 family)